MNWAMVILFTSRASCFIQTIQSIRKSSISLYSTRISFGNPPTDPEATILIGKKNSLRNLAIKANLVEDAVVDAMLSSGPSATTFLSATTGSKTLTLCTLPETVSRNNHPLSVHKITSNLKSVIPKHGLTSVQICDVAQIGPVVAAVSKALPLYNRKTDLPTDPVGNTDSTLTLSCYDENGKLIGNDREAEVIAEAVRLACYLVDSTPEELTTTSFAAQCQLISERFPTSVTMKEIVGSELKDKGYGGLYGVGKAAECPPRMIIMEYSPPANQIPEETIALVGKGILYDTGGLSLKSKEGMSGMKHDMAGAAGMLGGFLAAVNLQVNRKIILILCVAENAIGPSAFRNDDILTMYSGKTVEVNNCDAEGRLVLADGVAHATKHFDCDLIVDMATLTGAQLITTGKLHAGILANKEEIEQRAIQAGILSGDLVFPLLYAPELLMDEFKSMVADMKNSVKDRSNAQSSCAGHFIESHLSETFKGGWLHIDMAGPGTNDQRGTGFGIGLILSLLQAPGFR